MGIPLLVVIGEQSSGKSTLCLILMRVRMRIPVAAITQSHSAVKTKRDDVGSRSGEDSTKFAW